MNPTLYYCLLSIVYCLLSIVYCLLYIIDCKVIVNSHPEDILVNFYFGK